MHPDESLMLLTSLQSTLDDPNIQVPGHWREGDLAMWDERCSHRALSVAVGQAGGNDLSGTSAAPANCAVLTSMPLVAVLSPRCNPWVAIR